MAATPLFAQNTDEENIKKTLQAEADALKNQDADALKATWVDDANASYTYFARTGYSRLPIDSVRARVARAPKTSSPTTRTLENNENFIVRIKGDMAWVQYDHVTIFPNNDSTIYPYSSVARYHAYRLMEKDDNKWKTVSFINTLPDSYQASDHSIESDLNEVGYALLRQKKLNEAIEALKLNVKLFPQSFNVYDSLGEAYAAAGNKKQAIENYQKSIELNANNANGKQMLAKLKAK